MTESINTSQVNMSVGSQESSGSSQSVQKPTATKDATQAPKSTTTQTSSPMPDFAQFRATLGELGKEKALDSIKTFQDLVKNYIEAQKLIGRSVQLPPKDLDPKERRKVIGNIINRLRKEGVLEAIPDHPSKYQFDIPEGLQLNEPLVNSFREICYRFQIPPTQAKALFNWYLNYQSQAEAQEDLKLDEAKKSLKKEWGGLYTRKMEAARRAAQRYLGPDAEEIFSELPVEIGLRFVKAFAAIGEPLLEDAIMSGEVTGIRNIEDVEKEIQEIMSNPKHPLWDQTATGHKEAVDKWMELQKQYAILKQSKGGRG